MSELDARIERWVEAGLIGAETAADLRRYEDEHPAAPSPSPSPSPSQGGAPLALVGEVLGYLGAVLTVSAVAFLLSRTWDDLPQAARVALVAALVALVGGVGARITRVASDPAQRLASVLLVAAVALLGWLTWVVLSDATTMGDESLGRWVMGVCAVAASALYVWRRRALTQIAALAAIAALLTTIVAPWDGESTEVAWGLSWAVLGASWLALAISRLLVPRGPALVTGGLLAYVGLLIAGIDDLRGWMLGIAVALAAWMIGVAVARRELVLLMVPGAIALLTGVPQLLDHLVGDTLLSWLGVLLTGLALVGVAVWMVRDRRRPHPLEDDQVVARI